MKDRREVQITRFELWMQKGVHDLIVEGLEEHFGFNDPMQNPDLISIADSYRDSIFLVAMRDESVLAAGALVHERVGVGRVVRMSVTPTMRRKGIGSLMLDALIREGVRLGDREFVLETTADWVDANHFYMASGFELIGIDRDRNEANYRLSLPA